MSREEELLREIFSKEGERPSDKKCQCPNYDCINLATGNHYINMTVPVCRECFEENVENNE